MSSVIILDSTADSSQQIVSTGYMGSLYLLVGAGFLFDILTRIFGRDGHGAKQRDSMVIISFVIISFLIALTGFIMSCFKRVRVSNNRGKLIFIFVCFFIAAIGAVMESSMQAKVTPRSVMYNSFAPLLAKVARGLELVAILAAAIQVLFLSSKNHHPQIPLLSKLVVACSTILSFAINGGMFSMDVSSQGWLVCYYILICCAVLVGLGTVWGIVYHFKNEQQRIIAKSALVSEV